MARQTCSTEAPGTTALASAAALPETEAGPRPPGSLLPPYTQASLQKGLICGEALRPHNHLPTAQPAEVFGPRAQSVTVDINGQRPQGDSPGQSPARLSLGHSFRHGGPVSPAPLTRGTGHGHDRGTKVLASQPLKTDNSETSAWPEAPAP